MPLSESILSNIKWNSFSLRFNSPRLESHYKKHTFASMLLQSRLGLLLGAMMYEIYGILDYMLVTKDLLAQVTLIRVSTTFLILVVFALTFSRIYRKYGQEILSTIIVLASFSLLWKMSLIDQQVFPYYFSGLILIFFWIHSFCVVNFFYVLISAATIVVVAITSFLNIFTLSLIEFFCYSFILLITFSVSIFSAYTTEKRHRTLFLREKELDRERYIERERAMRDNLTNLPNRALLFDRIGQAIEDSNRNTQVCAGFFLDLDDFKKINDTYGHAAGDSVLKDVSERLKSSVRGADTVARLAGDEFFVLAQDIKNEEHALDLGSKLLNAIRAPYMIHGKVLDSLMSVSIGVCMFPYEGVVPSEVIARADRAMYQAKLGGKFGIVVAKTSLLRAP